MHRNTSIGLTEMPAGRQSLCLAKYSRGPAPLRDVRDAPSRDVRDAPSRNVRAAPGRASRRCRQGRAAGRALRRQAAGDSLERRAGSAASGQSGAAPLAPAAT